MNDKFLTKGKYYLNGTCVNYAAVPPLISIDQTEERNYRERSFRIGFKQRMKIFDAITLQHYEASRDPSLYHCFFTATFSSDSVPDNPNNVFSKFLDKMRKAGFANYVWTRELTQKGTPHYHFTTVGKKKPINATKGWSVNKCWCDSRGYYSSNAIRSSTIWICQNRACRRRHIHEVVNCIDCGYPVKKINQAVIHDIRSARAYVAKYIAKAEGDQRHVKGRTYAVSNGLTSHPPLDIDDALMYVYGFGGFFSDGRDVRQYDYAKIGNIKPEQCDFVYNQYREQQILDEKRRIESENMQQKRESLRNQQKIVAKTQKSIKF